MIQNVSLENQKLIRKAETLAQEERRITVELIRCLEEITRKMLYAELGYASIHEFCTKHLKLSDGSAQRRIAAMRLSRQVPIVQERILSGELSLSNASKIQVAVQRVRKVKKLEPKDQASLVEECLNLSQRECEVKLFLELPELKESVGVMEKSRPLDEHHTELKLVLNGNLKAKIDELQNLTTHSNPERSCIKLLERLVDQELAKLRKQRATSSVAVKSEVKVASRLTSTQIQYKPTHSAAEQVPLQPSLHPKKSSRPAIPIELRRQVWTRARNQCQFPGCHSKSFLQIEHHVPFGKGGEHQLENLRLLCRSHNLLRAKQAYGTQKMKKHLPHLG